MKVLWEGRLEFNPESRSIEGRGCLQCVRQVGAWKIWSVYLLTSSERDKGDGTLLVKREP